MAIDPIRNEDGSMQFQSGGDAFGFTDRRHRPSETQRAQEAVRMVSAEAKPMDLLVQHESWGPYVEKLDEWIQATEQSLDNLFDAFSSMTGSNSSDALWSLHTAAAAQRAALEALKAARNYPKELLERQAQLVQQTLDISGNGNGQHGR